MQGALSLYVMRAVHFPLQKMQRQGLSGYLWQSRLDVHVKHCAIQLMRSLGPMMFDKGKPMGDHEHFAALSRPLTLTLPPLHVLSFHFSFNALTSF